MEVSVDGFNPKHNEKRCEVKRESFSRKKQKAQIISSPAVHKQKVEKKFNNNKQPTKIFFHANTKKRDGNYIAPTIVIHINLSTKPDYAA